MSAALLVGAASAGVVIGVALELPVSRLPARRSLRDGPVLGAGGIGWRARPLVLAVTTGALFVALALRFGADAALPAYWILAAGAVALSATDLETYLLPNRIVYPLAAAGIVALGLAAVVDGGAEAYVRALAAGALSWVAFFLAHLAAPRSLGFGDVKLAFVLGLFLGWLGWGEVVLGFFFGFAAGALVGIATMLLYRRGRSEPLPFGPFLVAGALAAILVGAPVLDWYRGS